MTPVRLPVEGGEAQPIAIPGDAVIPGTRLTTSVAGTGGRIVLNTVSPERWAWGVSSVSMAKIQTGLRPRRFHTARQAAICRY